MLTPNNPPLLFEVLSIELWEWIFLLTSPRDILRLSSVRNAVYIIRFRPFAKSGVFKRSTALVMNLYSGLPQFNTKSTFLRQDYNATRGLRHLSLIAAKPSRCTSGVGRL